ncbi:MAG TPA: amidohydrolase family protein [Alphaproteobacteria bacterium]|jgi:cytosine/adenosine deaminase-related metal-dependent hydrolase
MSDFTNISRRGLFGTAAAIGAASMLNPIGKAMAQGAPAAGAAQQIPRGEYVVRNACVLTMDPQIGNLLNGDVHVRNGAIVAVGANLAAPGAEVIDGKGMIVMPGMIETHWHMWGAVARNMAGDDEKHGYFPYSRVLGQLFTPEDNARGVRLALAEAINGGITTVNNWSHNLLSPEYADAEIKTHIDVGGRALFSYGYSRKTQRDETLPLKDVARVQKQWFGAPVDGLLTLGIATRGPENNTLEIVREEIETARKLGVRITSHMGTDAERVVKAKGIKVLAGANLLGPDVLLVHDTNTNEEDLHTLAATKTPVSMSPFTEGRTGFGITPVLDFLRVGVPVSLSVDTTLLCGNADMFAIMKAIQNLADAVAKSEFGLPAARILQMSTMDGARALGLEDKVGSLTPGKRADLIVVRTDAVNMLPFTEPVHMIVQSAQPSNVDLVMVDGRILKRNGKLTTIDLPRLAAEAAETVARINVAVKDF